MSYRQNLQEIIDLLSLALQDANKFDEGSDAAGKRIRQAAQTAKNSLQEFRLAVQAERNSRKA